MPTKNYVLNVVLSDDLADYIRKASIKSKISMAEYIRRLIIIDKSKKSEND